MAAGYRIYEPAQDTLYQEKKSTRFKRWRSSNACK